jgi:transposase-like protein
MEGMGKKPRRRRSFTAEFKAEIVELCQRGDRSVGQVAKDFDLTETAVREWVRQAERDAGLLPSLGTVGDPYDNAVVESFWGRMQTELLNRQRWRTRVELANAIFEYIEGFHNRRRRHSYLGWISPLEFETEHRNQATAPQNPFRKTGA